ncbi:hypothetical protein Tco_0814185 [Tanacetum coccineum]
MQGTLLCDKQIRYYKKYQKKLAGIAGSSNTTSIVIGSIYLLCSGHNKNELKESQGKLKQAFIELCEKPRCLNNYGTTPVGFMELNVPLNESSWSEEDLKDPKKLYKMNVLLNAQREIAEKILDDQWEAKWRQEKALQDEYHQQRTMLELHDLATLESSECGSGVNQEQENEE